MSEENKTSAEVIEFFKEEYVKWLESQEGQTDSFKYEESFVEFMQKVGQHTLSKTVESKGESRNSKKK